MAQVRFEIECIGAREVFLAGGFNGWDPTARRMRRIRKRWDKFVAVVDLPPGRHEFKFIVDGEWICCPNAARATNDQGTENSVIEVVE